MVSCRGIATDFGVGGRQLIGSNPKHKSKSLKVAYPWHWIKVTHFDPFDNAWVKSYFYLALF